MRGVFNWSPEIEAANDFDPGADSREFDELVERADTESDRDARNDLFRQAEELVLRNAVAIPLGKLGTDLPSKAMVARNPAGSVDRAAAGLVRQECGGAS